MELSGHVIAEPARPEEAVGPGVVAATARDGRSIWKRVRLGIAILLFLFIGAIGYLAITAPLSKSLQPIAPPEITLLAADGTPIARNGAIIDAPVSVSRLPPHVVEAFLAIEDRRFYKHWGIDPRGIARAAWSNLTGRSTQGGSTITQQLAKFTFLTAERSLSRKARELLIAFWLEAWLTKDDILERYLSNAYFGDNTYGLRAASMHYFHRQPEKLTAGQGALLAGLMKAPSRLAPTNNFAASEKRMRLVLHTMVEAGYMTARQARAVATPKLDVRQRSELPTGTYFADWALPQARQIEAAGYAGQTYRTTLDSRLQAAAHRAIRQGGAGRAQVALVAMRRNGEVVAMIGGKDYSESPFNRVTQARRQPGSTFKLFVYLAALKSGMSPDDTIANTPVETGSYRPQNAGGAYSPVITLRDAFARSSNVAAVRLFSQVGDEAVIDIARRFGIKAPLPAGDPSLALGTASMTLLELTAAYAGVAANNFPVAPRAFPVPEAGWFDWLLDGKRSLSSRNHAAIEEMLRAAINRGTGRGAMLRGPNFGKTGTSQENRDALFVGYSGDLVVGVWVGNDDNSPLRGISGGTVPARIWRDFMRAALGERSPPSARPRDPEGPVQPLDVPEVSDIPVGQDSHVRIEDGQAVLSTKVEGVPLDVRLDSEGLNISPAVTPSVAPTP
jgi:penicillin-binding protein 1A